MKKQLSIAIFASASENIEEELAQTAKKIGAYLAKNEVKVVTGGCLGVPGLITKSAKDSGADTEGFFPDHDPNSQKQRPDNLDLQYFDLYHFIPGFTARSLEMINNVDGAIVINGRIGTLSEFSVALEEGLPLAVIQGTGGITDELEHIIKIAQKEFNSFLIFESDYKKAIDALISHINQS